MSPADASIRALTPEHAAYPAALAALLGEQAPGALWVSGDASLLQRPLTAIFCSVRVPPELVLPTLELTRAVRAARLPTIAGFQSPLERECLELLLRGTQPVVLCPARGVHGLRLPPGGEAALAEGRLLVLSGCPPQRRRASRALAAARNRLVSALAERLLVVHAEPGGRVHRLVEEALRWGKPVSCFAHPANHDLVLMGAHPVDPAHPLG